jgi:hypothetical protein
LPSRSRPAWSSPGVSAGKPVGTRPACRTCSMRGCMRAWRGLRGRARLAADLQRRRVFWACWRCRYERGEQLETRAWEQELNGEAVLQVSAANQRESAQGSGGEAAGARARCAQVGGWQRCRGDNGGDPLV